MERWFRELTDKALPGASSRASTTLVAVIDDYLDKHNADPKLFAWTASAESIIEKVERGAPALKASLRPIVGHCTS